jgi:hypothetical protein
MLKFLMAFVFDGIGSFIIWLFSGFKGKFQDIFYVDESRKGFKIFKRALGFVIVILFYLIIRKATAHPSY